MTRTSLYRHFDRDGRLLYVGISDNHLRRLAEHSQAAGWFDQITLITVEHFDTREDALRAESDAVRSEKPLMNKKLGRPFMDLVSTMVRLHPEQIARIDRLAGPNKRAEFIREAVARRLDMIERRNGQVQDLPVQKLWDAGEVTDFDGDQS